MFGTERFHLESWQEPCDRRLSRTDLWGPGGEIPPGYPTQIILKPKKACDIVLKEVSRVALLSEGFQCIFPILLDLLEE